MGRCSIMRAELRCTITGLQLAWHNGHRKVAVRVDSRAVLDHIIGDDIPSNQHASEVLIIRELIKSDWEVAISHIYREGNFAADYLTNLVHRFPRGIHLISLPDRNLSYFLLRDCIDISECRFPKKPWY
ncbi:Putative ribonuclease H protein At1g65750 [Linum perenne]